MQNYHDVISKNQSRGVDLFDSPNADEVKRRVSVAKPDEAENEFTQLLKLIPDPELREKIDSAAGRIAYAYEKLGFVEGYLSELSYACIV